MVNFPLFGIIDNVFADADGFSVMFFGIVRHGVLGFSTLSEHRQRAMTVFPSWESYKSKSSK